MAGRAKTFALAVHPCRRAFFIFNLSRGVPYKRRKRSYTERSDRTLCSWLLDVDVGASHDVHSSSFKESKETEPRHGGVTGFLILRVRTARVHA